VSNESIGKPRAYTARNASGPLRADCQAHRLEPCLTPRDRRVPRRRSGLLCVPRIEWKVGIDGRRTHLALGFERSSLTGAPPKGGVRRRLAFGASRRGPGALFFITIIFHHPACLPRRREAARFPPHRARSLEMAIEEAREGLWKNFAKLRRLPHSHRSQGVTALQRRAGLAPSVRVTRKGNSMVPSK
jgi:hypothetical protein